MATDLPITKTRGDTRRHIFIVKDSDGVVVDISTWASFELAVTSIEDPPDATTLLEAMTGALTAGGTDGRVHFVPSGTLAVADAYYDAQAIDANSEKVTFARGTYNITQDRGKS